MHISCQITLYKRNTVHKSLSHIWTKTNKTTINYDPRGPAYVLSLVTDGAAIFMAEKNSRGWTQDEIPKKKLMKLVENVKKYNILKKTDYR